MILKKIKSRLQKVYGLMSRKEGFGMSELLGIAATLIIAAFVIIPGLRTLANTVMAGITSWWGTTIAGHIFPTI